MPPSDTTCKNTKPKEQPPKLAAEKEMFLLVNLNGSKYFRLKYRFGSIEKTLAPGASPETNLKSAREKQVQARELLANGIDPSENRKAIKSARAESSANSFEALEQSHTHSYDFS